MDHAQDIPLAEVQLKVQNKLTQLKHEYIIKKKLVVDKLI